MMYNCLFDDLDCNLRVRLKSFIQNKNGDYYLPIIINRSDVMQLMDNGIYPTPLENGKYELRIRISNKTYVSINGLQLTNFENPYLSMVDPKKITLKEMCLRKYASNARRRANDCPCYATKVIFSKPI